MFKTRLDVLGTILGVFGFLKTFKKHFENSMKHWAKKIFRKKYPQNMFKTQLDTFGNDFGHFWNFEKIFIY